MLARTFNRKSLLKERRLLNLASAALPEPIAENARLHDLVAREYETCHGEIFNRTEQRRLAKEVQVGFLARQSDNLKALDFGSGTGNLTGKLLEEGAHVIAADVSAGMLTKVEKRYERARHEGRLETCLLNGRSPLPFADAYFGFIASYSVLHHVPDYLAAVRELIRVLAPGGVLYLDHEHSEKYWHPSVRQRLHRLIMMPRYSFGRVWARVRRLWGVQDPPLPPPGQRAVAEEGDIHIYADDHVEWSEILRLASEARLETLTARDYLLCREGSRLPLRYWLCLPFVTDMSLFVARKPLARGQ